MFTNCFYIRKVNGIYNLRLIETHFCITVGTLEKCLEMVTSYVKRYKTDRGVYNAMRNLDCQGKVGRVAFEECEEWYSEASNEDKHYSLIKEAIKEGEDYLKENTPQKRIKKRLSKVNIKPIEVTSPSRPSMQPPTGKPCQPLHINKPKILNIPLF